MRKLSHTPQDTEIEIADVVGGCTHVFYARQPTDRERFLYEAKRYERRGNTIYDRLPGQRRHYGRKVLTGFVKGTMGDEEGNPIASDPEDPEYREDWADLIAASFPQAFDVVARVMFESTSTVPRRTGEEEQENIQVVYGDEPAEDEAQDGEAREEMSRPLASSSSGKSS